MIMNSKVKLGFKQCFPKLDYVIFELKDTLEEKKKQLQTLHF